MNWPRRVPALAVLSILGIVSFLWPLWAQPTGAGDLAHTGDAPWIMIGLLGLAVIATASDVSRGDLDAKGVAMLGVLAAVGTALRIPTGGIAGTELLFFALIPSGRIMGRHFGFLLGALTLFVSALATGGIGPWLPFQMLGAAWIGWAAGLLPSAAGKFEGLLMAGFAVVAAFWYGALLNFWFWPFATGNETNLSFHQGDAVVANLRRFWAFHLATSLGWDLMRAISVATMCILLGPAICAALRRGRRHAAFDEPVTFQRL
jgi:energy-coupling factor transport system substrate-specific component